MGSIEVLIPFVIKDWIGGDRGSMRSWWRPSVSVVRSGRSGWPRDECIGGMKTSDTKKVRLATRPSRSGSGGARRWL
ncbi:MAG: hypothetical protein WCG47_01930 [Dermatophilaceae bacterium]